MIRLRIGCNVECLCLKPNCVGVMVKRQVLLEIMRSRKKFVDQLNANFSKVKIKVISNCCSITGQLVVNFKSRAGI